MFGIDVSVNSSAASVSMVWFRVVCSGYGLLQGEVWVLLGLYSGDVDCEVASARSRLAFDR